MTATSSATPFCCEQPKQWISRFADAFRYGWVRVLHHQGIAGPQGKAAEWLGLPESRQHRPQC